MTLKPYKCPNCGATVNTERMICEYCGTKFKAERDPFDLGTVKLIAVTPGIKTLGCRMMMSKYEMDNIPKEWAEHLIRRQLADKITEAIMKEIEIQQDFDIDIMKYRFTTTLRVVDPSFRF